jgi:hypothetical protein
MESAVPNSAAFAQAFPSRAIRLVERAKWAPIVKASGVTLD